MGTKWLTSNWYKVNFYLIIIELKALLTDFHKIQMDSGWL